MATKLRTNSSVFGSWSLQSCNCTCLNSTIYYPIIQLINNITNRRYEIAINTTNHILPIHFGVVLIKNPIGHTSTIQYQVYQIHSISFISSISNNCIITELKN